MCDKYGIEDKISKSIAHAVARTDTSTIKVSINDVTKMECKEQLSGKALGVIAMIQNLLRKKLRLGQFFQKPTIAEIVELLEENTEILKFKLSGSFEF